MKVFMFLLVSSFVFFARHCNCNVQASPRVTVFGAGALGSFYGSRIVASSNKEVTFFSRSKVWNEHCMQRGLLVKSNVYRDELIQSGGENRVEFVHRASDLRPSDYVIVTLKGVDDCLSSLKMALPRVLNKDGTTRIIIMSNGMIDSAIVDMVKSSNLPPVKAIFGNCAFVCVNKVKPGVVSHTFKGFVKGGVAFCSGEAAHELKVLEDFWNGAVPFEPLPSLLYGRWLKSLWNVPFNMACVLNNCTTALIANDVMLRRKTDEIMKEVRQVVNADLMARGDPILTLADVQHMWELTDNMGYVKNLFVNLRCCCCCCCCCC